MVVDSSTQYENIIKKLKEPFVLKQCSEGSSIGIYIIESKEEYLQHFSEIEKSNDWIIAEQFMQGDEYTSTFLDGRALPIIKIQAKNHEFYDYDAKYLSDETQYICPCGLDAEIEMAINEECERAFNLFNIKGWGRLDFFLDQHNAPVILEINTVPGMTTHSLVPMSAKEAGIDFESTGLVVSDSDIGVYCRPEQGNFVLVGSEDPPCDAHQWVDDPDNFSRDFSDQATTQALRLAQRMTGLTIPSRMGGVVDLYDVSDDWLPIYDRSSLAGFYMACGSSGNQFKNAPAAGRLMAGLIDYCESGSDHDSEPFQFSLKHTNYVLDTAEMSRRRTVNANSSFSVLG